MNKLFKKFLAAILMVAIVLCSAPISGLADIDLPNWFDFSIKSSAATETGTCGENLTWSFDTETGTLTISGTGDMDDYEIIYPDGGITSTINSPWSIYTEIIENIIIESGVTTIGNYAFEECKSLVNIAIPNSITSIGYRALHNCSLLENLIIPSSVNNIGDYALDGCYGLKSVDVDKSNKHYSSDEYGVLFNKNKTNLIKYPAGNARTNYVIPNSVDTVEWSSFMLSQNLENIVIGSNVKYIGAYAFYNCSNIKNLIIPNNVLKIGLSAFERCSRLESVVIGNGVQLIEQYAFMDCDMLSNIYYVGTEEEWKSIRITDRDVAPFTTATIHYNYKSEPDTPEKVKGDANGDGKVTAVDARAILQHAAGIKSISADELANLDMTGDGKVTALDGRWILQIAAGLKSL